MGRANGHVNLEILPPPPPPPTPNNNTFQLLRGFQSQSHKCYRVGRRHTSWRLLGSNAGGKLGARAPLHTAALAVVARAKGNSTHAPAADLSAAESTPTAYWSIDALSVSAHPRTERSSCSTCCVSGTVLVSATRAAHQYGAVDFLGALPLRLVVVFPLCACGSDERHMVTHRARCNAWLNEARRTATPSRERSGADGAYEVSPAVGQICTGVSSG
jgi:hypothetical protein